MTEARADPAGPARAPERPALGGARLWRLPLGIGLLLVLVLLVDPAALRRAAAGADPGWLAAGLGCAVAANLVSALRWWTLARWLGADVSARWALGRYFGGVALNALLPGAIVGGDLYRVHALRRHGLDWGPAAASVLVDRLAGLWALIAIGFAAAGGGLLAAAPVGGALATAFPGAVADAAWALPLLATAAVMLAGPALLVAAVGRHGARDASEAPAAPCRWVRTSWVLCRRAGAAVQMRLQLGLSVLVQLASIATLACAGAALGVTLDAWAWAVAAVPVFLLATLPVSFGGWGTREAAAIVALGLFGVAAPPALAVGLLYGMAALLQAVPGVALLIAEARAAAR